MAARCRARLSVLCVVVLVGCQLGWFGCLAGLLPVLSVSVALCLFVSLSLSLFLSLSLSLFFSSLSSLSLSPFFSPSPSPCLLAQNSGGFLFFYSSRLSLSFSFLGGRPGRGFFSLCCSSFFPCKAASPPCLRLSFFLSLPPPPPPPSSRPASPPSLCLLFSSSSSFSLPLLANPRMSSRMRKRPWSLRAQFPNFPRNP